MISPGRKAILLAEINQDPAGLGYTGKTTDQIVALMNQPRSQTPQQFQSISVSPQLIAQVLIYRAKWEAIKIASDTPAAAGHVDAFRLYALSGLGSLTLDFNTSQAGAMIDNLIAAGILVAADKQAIINACRGEIFASRAQIIGLDATNAAEILETLA